MAVEPDSSCAQRILAKFGKNKRLTVVSKGLADSEGEIDFLISTENQTSTMSQEWKQAVGYRLPNSKWPTTVKVPVTTLDRLIERYGQPAFCKIDVEGFEFQVLQGLTQPLKTLSFEYTPEIIEPTLHCIARLAALGNYEFNFSIGETMTMVLPAWVSAAQIGEVIAKQPAGKSGDIYARLIGLSGPARLRG